MGTEYVGSGKWPELDADSLNQIMVRLVSTGTADHLSACSCVCRAWYMGSLNEDLWRILLLRKWGPDACQETQTDRAHCHRSSYIRSVTTRVLIWGQGGKCETDAFSTLPILNVNELPSKTVGVKAVSAGSGFSSAVCIPFC